VDAGASRSLVNSLKVKGVPTFLFYKKGVLFDSMTGSHLKKEQIRAKTEALREWVPAS